MKTTSAIIPAAGNGKRLPGEVPKQFRELGGLPVLAWSIRALAAAGVSEILVGAAEDQFERVSGLAAGLLPDGLIKPVPGGPERQDTVRACLAQVRADAEVIVIHDAARPFVSAELIGKAIAAASRSGACTVAIRPADTIKFEHASRGIRENLDRDRLWQVQTPQAFARDIICRAHEAAREQEFTGTDDTVLVERIGASVEIVRGDRLNFKITDPGDWEMAAALVAACSVKPAAIPPA